MTTVQMFTILLFAVTVVLWTTGWLRKEWVYLAILFIVLVTGIGPLDVLLTFPWSRGFGMIVTSYSWVRH